MGMSRPSLFVFGGYFWMEEQKGGSSRVTGTESSKPYNPEFNAAPVPVSGGVMQWPSNPGVAPLGIKTRSGNDYYAKLIDSTGRVVMTMYVEGGAIWRPTYPLELTSCGMLLEKHGMEPNTFLGRRRHTQRQTNCFNSAPTVPSIRDTRWNWLCSLEVISQRAHCRPTTSDQVVASASFSSHS